MGIKVNQLAECMVTALIKDIGPRAFAVALNNACSHGNIFDDSPVVVLDENDAMLNAWFVGIEQLSAVAKWMETGKKPKSLTASPIDRVKGTPPRNVFPVIETQWVITSDELVDLLWKELKVRLVFTNTTGDTEHHFSSVSREDFLDDLELMVDSGERLNDLRGYLLQQTGLKCVFEERLNVRLQNIIRKHKA